MASHTNHEGFVIGAHNRTFEIRYKGDHGQSVIARYIPKTDDEHVLLHNAMVSNAVVLFQLSEGEVYLVP